MSATLPTPPEIADAIIVRLGLPAAQVRSASGSRLAFRVAQQDENVDELARGTQEMPGVFVQCESVTPGDNVIAGQSIWLIRFGVSNYHRGGNQQNDERDAWAVNFSIARAVGRELADPLGITGDGGMFGYATGLNRLVSLTPEADAMTVKSLEAPGEEEPGQNAGVVKGYYAFLAEYRMTINGQAE